MDQLSTLFGKRQLPAKPRRHTERGDIFDTILSHLNPPRAKKGLPPISYKRLGYLLTAIPTKDLYSLISKCDDAQRRGFPWSAIFWKEIKPNKQGL
jgi:hypothetical protein